MREMQDWEIDREFDEFIDEITDDVVIFGMTYMPSKVLKECDPVAYRVMRSDWMDPEGIEEL